MIAVTDDDIRCTVSRNAFGAGMAYEMDMGVPSRLHADIGSAPGQSIRVSGAARQM